MITPSKPVRVEVSGSESGSRGGYAYPPLGGDPSSEGAGTSPGSFANRSQIAPGVAGARTYFLKNAENLLKGVLGLFVKE